MGGLHSQGEGTGFGRDSNQSQSQANTYFQYRELFQREMPHILCLLVEITRQADSYPPVQESGSDVQKVMTDLLSEISDLFSRYETLSADWRGVAGEIQAGQVATSCREFALTAIGLVDRAEVFMDAQAARHHAALRECFSREGQLEEREKEVAREEFLQAEIIKDAAADIRVALSVVSGARSDGQAFTLGDLLAVTSSHSTFVRQALNTALPVLSACPVALSLVEAAAVMHSSMQKLFQQFRTTELELVSYLEALKSELDDVSLGGIGAFLALQSAVPPLVAAVHPNGAVRFAYRFSPECEQFAIDFARVLKKAFKDNIVAFEKRGIATQHSILKDEAALLVALDLQVPVGSNVQGRVSPDTLRIMRRDTRQKDTIQPGDLFSIKLGRDSAASNEPNATVRVPGQGDVIELSFARGLLESAGGQRLLRGVVPQAARLAKALGTSFCSLVELNPGVAEHEEDEGQEEDLCIDPSAYVLRLSSQVNLLGGDSNRAREQKVREYLDGWKRVPGSANEFETPDFVSEPYFLMPADGVYREDLVSAIETLCSSGRLGYLDIVNNPLSKSETVRLLTTAGELLGQVRTEGLVPEDICVWFDKLFVSVPYRRYSFSVTDSKATLIGRGWVNLGTEGQGITIYPWTKLAELNKAVCEILGELAQSGESVRVMFPRRLREAGYDISGALVETIIQNQLRALSPFNQTEASKVVTVALRAGIDGLVFRTDPNQGVSLSILNQFEVAADI